MNKVMGGAGDLVAGKPTTYQENLYLAVNGEWQEKAKIAADKSSAGASMDLDIDIEKTLMKDFHDLSKNENDIKNPEFLQAVKLYRLAQNEDFLNNFHEKPILADIQRIEAIHSLADLNQGLADLDKDNFPLPVHVDVDADMKDTSKNVVYVDGANLILPDKSYYADDNESGKKLLAKYIEVANKLLVMIGYSKTEAAGYVDKTVTFDKMLVPIVKSSEEWADYTKIYNPMNFDEFGTKSDNLDLKTFVTAQIQATPDQIIDVQPRYLDNVDKLINDASFENIKAWMIVSLVMNNASLLDEDFRSIIGEYTLASSGAAQLPNRTKFAYHLAENTFSEVVGIYYGQKYFGEKAKADVRSMIEQMIAIYEQRLSDNDWLSEDTKKKAIVKLEKIVIKVGYPEHAEAVYQKLSIAENKSLYENITNIKKILTQDKLEQYKKPVDRTKWLMPGQMVNACYDPTRNDITFPAGILQEPFYSLQQTVSENYGGIGSVIAHEISHAFDNNGAQFDEYGNIHNWWTKEDYAKFKQLTQKMIDQFEGLEFAGGKVNGTLVVSENIADVSGLRCAIEAAKKDANYDPKEFFITWAKTWRFKATKQLNERLLAIDVHAPQPLRANVIAQDIDEFYDAFEIKPGDGMWTEKDQRVAIW